MESDIDTCDHCQIQHDVSELYELNACETCAAKVEKMGDFEVLKRELLQLSAANSDYSQSLALAKDQVERANKRLQAQTAEINGMKRAYSALMSENRRLAISLSTVVSELEGKIEALAAISDLS